MTFDDVVDKVQNEIPEGYSEGWYSGSKYGITKQLFNQGKSLKLFAEQLGGNDYISFNYYQKADGNLFRPCEMPEYKVIEFLQGLEF